MANSGAKLHPDCVKFFNEFKGNANYPTHDFLIMKLDGVNIVPDLCLPIGTSSADERYKDRAHPAFDQMTDHLLEKGSGYAFYILKYETPTGLRQKVVFITYADDAGPAKTKMTITSSKAAVEKGCPGFGIKIQANSREDLAYAAIEAVVMAK